MKFAIITDPHLNAYPSKKQEFFDFLVKMDNEVEGFICAGDWCSNSVVELEEILALCRKATSKTILAIFGNHDLWDSSKSYSLDEILDLHESLCKKYNIVYLEKEIFETEQSSILGYMGWYGVYNTNNTVDYDYIPKNNSEGLPAYHFLNRIESKGIYRVVDHITTKNKVCVTHFSFFGDEAYKQYNAHDRNGEILADNCNTVISGHSHKKTDFVIKNCHFYNPGADYNHSPEFYYIILDL